jgi:thiamine biosynthesis lipoprotein
VTELASASFRALGTTATVAVTDRAALSESQGLLEEELRTIDVACSRFRDDSELLRVQAASGRDVHVSRLFLDSVRVALRAARLTAGLVTPTIGRPLALAGYDRDLALIRPSSQRPVLAAAPDWRLIAVDRARETVRVPAGVELDLGATAKALAADRAASAIADRLSCGVLVSLGGDIRVAGKPPAGGWPILVDDAHDAPSACASRVLLSEGGLATSSVTTRRWRRAGRELHHILDPRTGAPATGPWRTASVAAASCVDANIASTAAILLGEAAPGWLASRRLPARLVLTSGKTVAVAGWPEEAVV